VDSVSSEPGTYITGDDHKVHYIGIDLVPGQGVDKAYMGLPSSVYEGADVVMLGHRKQNNETEAEARQRQTAIYQAAYSATSGAFDPDLLAPFMIYYEGIDDFNLSSHKMQWWSSGTRTSGIPQNRMRGDFLLTTGDTIEDYIDDALDQRNIDKCFVDAGSNTWILRCDNQWQLDTGQSWNTECTFTFNGMPWTVNLNDPGTTAVLR
jgi:hypothetical protein